MDAVVNFNGAKYDCLLFDLDDTLYPLSSGINFACRKNIEDYMLKYLHMEESEVPRMCLELYREYGTTMAGLKALEYEFDNDEFHEYVHGNLPYETLRPDPVLRNLLLSTPQRKIVFTNSDKAHTARVLNKLGLGDCFEGVICFETLNHKDNEPVSKSNILCKPSVEAVEAAISIANLDPTRTIFFDDSVRNIASGKAAGLHTVIVLNAFVHGDENLFNNYPELQEASVWVYFHSSIPEFNKVECWGPLNDAVDPTSKNKKRMMMINDEQDKEEEEEASSSKWEMLVPCTKPCRCCFPPTSLIPWTPSLSQEQQQEQQLPGDVSIPPPGTR